MLEAYTAAELAARGDYPVFDGEGWPAWFTGSPVSSLPDNPALVPVEWHPLCTVAQIVAELKLTDKAPDVDSIQAKIDAASDAICMFCKQSFGEAGVLTVPPAVNQAAVLQVTSWYLQDSSRLSDAFISEVGQAAAATLASPRPLLFAVQRLVRPHRLVTLR